MYIHCDYCGTQFNSKLRNCPNCNADVANNTELKEQENLDKKIAGELKRARDEATRLKWEEFDQAHPYKPYISPERIEAMRLRAITVISLTILFAAVLLLVSKLLLLS